jgi:membrane-associated phospholipid phosphatase
MDRRTFLATPPLALATATVGLATTSAAPAPSKTLLEPAIASTNWRTDVRGLFSKTFAHNADGSVVPESLAALGDALAKRDVPALERLPVNNELRLITPLAALAWKNWAYADQVALPSAPRWDSDALADQALELYWMALLRDERLVGLERERAARDAASELAQTPSYTGLKPESLFRVPLANAQHGYAISQLLWMPIPYGAHPWWQAYKTPFPGQDFVTEWGEWLRVQNGEWPKGILNHHSELHYLRTGRDLAEYVRWDFSYQAFINAGNILLGDPHRPRAALHPSNPYKTARTQNGFATLGGAELLAVVARAADMALKAAWWVKWMHAPLLRPEEYGGLIEKDRVPSAARLKNSEALKRIKQKFGSYLLPQAYPEGAPGHPSFPSGHATIAGACATVLKAFISPSYEFRFPLEPTRDGRDWGQYAGPKTNARIEIDKLAANVAAGRQWAGIHWQADSLAGLRLGEQVGLAVLREAKAQYAETAAGWFKGFDVITFEGKTESI